MHNALVEKHALERCHKALLSVGWSDQILRPYLYDKNDAVLILKGISRHFGDFEVLDRVDLTIKRGSIVGVCGPTASGKTTLLNVMAGILNPSQGVIQLAEDVAFVDLTPALARINIGYSMQHPSFYPELSIRDNLRHYLSLYGREKELESFLEEFSLEKVYSVRAQDASKGTQRKLDIALAIAHHPNLLLLDEPFADLDAENKAKVWQTIGRLHDEGVTIVVASKEISEIRSHLDQVLDLGAR